MSIPQMHDRILAFADKESGRGATPEDIARAERLLRVSLPESYRCFLTNFGWARFSHQELYGLGRDVPLHLDLVRNTIAEWSEMGPAQPTHLVPVMSDGSGNHFCLDTLNPRAGEGPLVFWDHEQPGNQIPAQLAETFDAWMLNLLAELTSV